MKVCPPLVTYYWPAVLRQPGQRALHHPSMPAQPVAVLFTLSGYPALDATLPQNLAALLGIVGAKRSRTLARRPRLGRLTGSIASTGSSNI
jgi:hypothetical protein